MSGNSKKPRLAVAAEALIEAASLESDAVTQKQLLANLESLKTSFDAKINTLNQHLVDVKSEIGALKILIEEDCKRKTLESARALTKLGSFEYYEGQYGSLKDSSDLAKTILEWFSVGYGVFLPQDGRMNYNNNSEQDKKDFRDKISKQIKHLINRGPRLVEDKDGRWTIHYS